VLALSRVSVKVCHANGLSSTVAGGKMQTTDLNWGPAKG